MFQELTAVQQAAVDAGATSFLLGSAGSGKTTALHHRLHRLLTGGEPAYTMLVLVAEPEQRQAFLEVLHRADAGPYTDLKITTYNRMAQEMVTLFWPLVARPAGFARPYHPPTLLSYDLAQLLMWHVITPMMAEGAFADIRLRPQQIVSQLLDTLNRAALNGLALDEAVARQINSWAGEPIRLRQLQDAASAARSFRRSCLDNSLLDLSLIVEVFDTQLVRHPEFHKYFSERYRHLIVDNVEEQTPAGQNFVRNLMDATQTTAIAYDVSGGYKRFLAADPLGANQFYDLCHTVLNFEESFVTTQAMIDLANLVENHLQQTEKPTTTAAEAISDLVIGRYRREMVQDLMTLLTGMIDEEGVAPDEIAIIAPYLDGALQYMVAQALQSEHIPYYLLRRRSSPREEPRVRAWLTWLALAHPHWEIEVSAYDVAEALTLSIQGIDPARAALLATHLYDPGELAVQPVSNLPDRVAGRIDPEILSLVEELRLWLDDQPAESMDVFLYDLFTNVLSQPRFHPEPDTAGAAVCDWLVRAATRLRQAADAIGFRTPAEIGAAFFDGINQGLVTANPPELGEPPDLDGVMISTIYGYLLAGKPVRVQVWLETAATGWWDIPNQPLSNAFVLAQSYDSERPWTIEDDFAIRNQLLSRIIRGLTNRCQERIIVATSDLDRRGVRQDGPLWLALQPLLPI